MATTDLQHAPGDIIELRRLPGVRLEVAAVWKRESFGDREIYMLEVREIINGYMTEVFFIRPDDERETLLTLSSCEPCDEPQSSAIVEGE